MTMTIPKLRNREETIMRYIIDHVQQHHYAPSIREITNACHISSVSVTMYNLNTLAAKGFLNKAPGKARAIILTQQAATWNSQDTHSA